jgi:ArsR family transcriptional regulator
MAAGPAGSTKRDDPVICLPPVLVGAPIAVENAEELARALAALADPVRLRLLSLVAARTEVCSCELEVPLGKSQPTISHHTKVLAARGLIVGERRGRWTWWHVVPERLAAIREAIGGERRLAKVDMIETPGLPATLSTVVAGPPPQRPSEPAHPP